jgi:hypothetical protein
MPADRPVSVASGGELMAVPIHSRTCLAALAVPFVVFLFSAPLEAAPSY